MQRFQGIRKHPVKQSRSCANRLVTMTFLLIKFFDNPDYADRFARGQLYLNRLSYFKRIEGDDTQAPSGRIDRHEGTIGWMQPGRGTLTINGVEIQDAQIQIQKNWLNHLHVLCVHAVHSGDLDLDRLAAENNVEPLRKRLTIPNQCLSLGKHAVVIRNVPEFLSRVEAACKARRFRLRYGLVKYYDPTSFHGNFADEDSVFRKQTRYMPQREFRFAVNTGTLGEDHLDIAIGDIRKLTLRLKSAELNGEQLIGGEMRFTLPPETSDPI